MNLRTLAVCIAVSSTVFVAACGDDDEDKQGGSTTATTSTQEPASADGGTIAKDVEPRSAAPNVAGGDAPIEEFAQKAANDAANYFEKVFAENSLPYNRPTVTFHSTPGDDGCGGQFDPAERPYLLCANPGVPSVVNLSGPDLDGYRAEVGDAAVAFLSGYGVALDANDQLSGTPIAKGEEVSNDFANVAVCFTGAWLRNLGDRELLDAGDSKEVMDIAAAFLPGEIGFGSDVVAFGHDNGAAQCQTEYGAA